MGVVPLLSCEKVDKHYGPVEALTGIDIDIGEGEIVGLAGDNGAGKSTLMKIVAGSEHPTAGSIMLQGKPFERHSVLDARSSGIEMVYQDLALCENLNVVDNIFLGREIKRRVLPGVGTLSRGEMTQRAGALLDRLEIPLKSLVEPVASLSGGQRQAVAICRALTFSPHLVLLDEPTAALSVHAVAPLLQLIRRLPNQGTSVLIVSHRLSDLLSVSDRIYVLRNGRVVTNLRTSETTAGEVVRLMAGVEDLDPEIDRRSGE